MILFVFEGENREPELFATIQKMFFPRDNERITYSFGNNIYELYNELSKLDDAGDLVSLLQERCSGQADNPFEGLNSSDFSEIYLFFDYDFQNKNLELAEINRQLKEMLSKFNDETEYGKLYINYPMIESIRYTKELPDANYYEYVISRADCSSFKKLAADFSAYSSLDFILIDSRKDVSELSEKKLKSLRDNWEHLKKQNVNKANYICHGKNEAPNKKEEVSQEQIFESQLQKHVNKEQSEVAILNAFPLFLYEYFK
jgi:hypothetical protein